MTNLVPVHSFYRAMAPGLDYTLPFGLETIVDYLVQQFPSEQKSVRRFFKVSNEIYDAILSAGVSGDSEKIANLPLIKPYIGKNIMEALSSFFRDQRIIFTLMQAGNYFSIPHYQASFLEYLACLMVFVRFGAHQLKGKSQALSQALVETIQQNGGDVWLNAGIDSKWKNKWSPSGKRH